MENIQNIQTPAPETNHSSKTGLYIVIGLIVAIVVVGSLLVVLMGGKTTKSTNVSHPVGISTPVQANITPDGFVPSAISIKVGQPVIWKNYDTKAHTISLVVTTKSSSLPGFNSSALAQGQTYSFIFPTKGPYTYQDSSNAKVYSGTVIVK